MSTEARESNCVSEDTRYTLSTLSSLSLSLSVSPLSLSRSPSVCHRLQPVPVSLVCEGLCQLCVFFSDCLQSETDTERRRDTPRNLSNDESILACHAMPCLAMPCHAMPCHAMPCHAMPCHAMPCHAMPCHAMPCHAMPCHAMPCHAMPCHAVAGQASNIPG